MGEEVVAVALEIVANEIAIIAVGDEADAFGEERILDLDLLQADRSGLRAISAKPASSSTRSRWVMRRSVKANFAPSGKPWKIE